MTSKSMSTSGPTPAVQLDKEQARNAVGTLSVALGATAVLAPRLTARGFGVRAEGGALPLLVRMVGVRNAVMGAHTLQATGGAQAQAVQAGLAVGAVDALAVLLAARKGVMSKKAALGVLAVLGGIAALGVLASQED